jgi:hypothetical protein
VLHCWLSLGLSNHSSPLSFHITSFCSFCFNTKPFTWFVVHMPVNTNIMVSRDVMSCTLQIGMNISEQLTIQRMGRGNAIAQTVDSFPSWWLGFDPRSGHVGFVVDKVVLGQVFPEYFSFPCQFSVHRLLHIHHHLSSRAGTIGRTVADVPSGLSLTPPQGGEGGWGEQVLPNLQYLPAENSVTSQMTAIFMSYLISTYYLLE